MRKHMDNMKAEIDKAIRIGTRNQEIIKLAKNYCKNLNIEKALFGGTGMIEAETGLPIGVRMCSCRHARASGMAGMILEDIVADYWERNCEDCKKREPVGIPNILTFIDQRKRNREEEEKNRQRHEEEIKKAIKGRKVKRDKYRSSDQSKNAILDLIDKIDLGITENEKKLVETAKLAYDKFDINVQEVLFELIESKEYSKAECAIEILTIVAKGQGRKRDEGLSLSDKNDAIVDLDRLATVAIKALDSAYGGNNAASVLESWLNEKQKNQISENVIRNLVFIACPRNNPFINSSIIRHEPGPLLKAYKYVPDKILKVTKELLRIEEKWTRIAAAEAATYIFEKDSLFGVKIAPPLIDSLNLPDDHYDGGSAEGSAIRAIGMALIMMPDEIDNIIQERIRTADNQLKGTLLSIYEEILREERRGKRRIITKHIGEIVVARTLDVLINKPNDERINVASEILGSLKYGDIALLLGHEDQLIAAAAQIASELEGTASVLVGAPFGLGSLNAYSRNMRLQTVLDNIKDIIGQLGQIAPLAVGGKVRACLNNLKNESRLKSTLISTLGGIGSNKQGLPLVLPIINSALSDDKSLIRMSAVEAYGKIVEGNKVELPSHIQEKFLDLLNDPYVIVHQAAVKALKTTKLTENEKSLIRNKLLNLIIVYAKENKDPNFLDRCLNSFLSVNDKAHPLEKGLAEIVLNVIMQIRPYDRVDILRRYKQLLNTSEEYPRQLISLLREHEIYDLNIDDVLAAISELPVSEIVKYSSKICKGGKELVKSHQYSGSLELIEALSLAYCWEEVLALCEIIIASKDDTTENKPFLLHMNSYKIAAKIELGFNSNNRDETLRECAAWQDNYGAIKRDIDENKKRRDIFRSI
jgi:HEAT repeat protein